MLGQGQGFLTAPAKDEGVAPFEADHHLAGAGPVHQQPVDLVLG